MPLPAAAGLSLRGPGRLLLEAAAALLLLAEAAWLLAFGHSLWWLWGLLLVGQWLLTAAGLRRLGLFRTVGPVFTCDLVRNTRRGRYFLIRTLYGLLLLLVLWQVWAAHFWYRPGPVTTSEITAFAESFFATFLVVQFVLITLLTPAYTAGAITDEKERRTLEFILTTDLRDREIVLGKLGARLLNLAFLLLVGLPILGLLQLLGGIDPGLVVAGFASTAVTMVSMAGVSILCSVLFRKSRDAIVLAYLAILAYFIAAGLALLLHGTPLAAFPSTAGWQSPVTVGDLVDWFNSGNPFFALSRVFRTFATGTLDAELPVILGGYLLFHSLAALGCCAAAVLLVRRRALREGSGRRDAVRPRSVPPVTDQPMLWKERYVEAGLRLHWIGWAVVVLLVGASFVPFVLILGTASGSFFTESVNIWVRTVGTMVTCLLLLGVAVRAAHSVSGERERHTLDELLTTPLETEDILYAKWYGSVWSLRGGWFWLGGIYGLGVLTGGLNILALPLLFVAWGVYACFVASLGLWFSTVCRTSLRAAVCTVFTLLGLWGGHWLLWMCCGPVIFMGSGPGGGEALLTFFEFQAGGLTPPVALGALAFHGREFETFGGRRNPMGELLVCIVIGFFIWGIVGVGIWNMTVDRFSALYARGSPRTPRRPDLPPPRRRGNGNENGPQPGPGTW
jgi:ABC-type transport system involved in multi-copper enzyme maturation permease subunit